MDTATAEIANLKIDSPRYANTPPAGQYNSIIHSYPHVKSMCSTYYAWGLHCSSQTLDPIGVMPTLHI